jgi:glycosyltransferase involved in cell wall biosynthesis
MKNRHRWAKKLSFTLIESRILARAASIHYASEQEQLDALRLGVVQKSAVIPNAVDVHDNSSSNSFGRFRAKFPQLNGRIVLLFLSRLDPIKGLDLLLPAFAKVRQQYPELTLVLAGNGDPQFAFSLRQEAIRLGIASDILWAGFLDDKEKWMAMADADLFVLPSYSENFGIAVVEAMAHGLPVLITDRVDIHPEIDEHNAGFVTKCTPQSLAEALELLVVKSELRKEMGDNARRLVQEKYSLRTVGNQLVKLYENVVGNCRTRSHL